MISSPVELNHYALLGIERNASTAAIEEAYRAAVVRLPKTPVRRLCRFVFSGESAEALRQAYETLMNPQSRRTYDESLASAPFNWMPLS